MRRVLLDEQLNWRLYRLFGEGFEVDNIGRRGWKGTKNGALLALMEAAGFDVLLTIDQGIPHQQNLLNSTISVVKLEAVSNRIEDTAPIVEEGIEEIRSAPPGEVTSLP